VPKKQTQGIDRYAMFEAMLELTWQKLTRPETRPGLTRPDS